MARGVTLGLGDAVLLAIGAGNGAVLHLDLQLDHFCQGGAALALKLSAATVDEGQLHAMAKVLFGQRTQGIGGMQADELLADGRIGFLQPIHLARRASLVRQLMQVVHRQRQIAPHGRNQHIFFLLGGGAGKVNAKLTGNFMDGRKRHGKTPERTIADT